MEDVTPTDPTSDPSPRASRMSLPLEAALRDIENDAVERGWDAPPRLFALVATSDLLAREPALAASLDIDAVTGAGSLTPVEQEDLPPGHSLEESLERIAWPPEVLGAAVVVERLMVPAAAESAMPQVGSEALEWLSQHPDRQDVRLCVAVLRDGSASCAVRLRSHDEDASVLWGPRLVPSLVDALAATLEAPSDEG